MLKYAKFIDVLHINIEKETNKNTYYRKVIATTPNMQLVLMSLKPGQDIGLEVHPYITQFIRVEKGEGVAIIGDEEYNLINGDAVIIPLNTKHNIINNTKKVLKLYTIYSGPNHPYDRINVTKPKKD